MSIANKKSLNIALILMLLISTFIPNIAAAYTQNGSPDAPSITILKHEQEGEETNPLDGVEFTLTQTHSYNPETDEWTEVTDGVTLVGVTGSEGNDEGKIVFTKDDGLELGRYKVEETNGPDHVILNPDTGFIDIPMTSADGTTLDYDVTIEPKNEVIRGSTDLIKKDEDGNPLQGVKFGLYKEDGTPIDEDLTTDSEGKISVTDLGVGEYYFRELATTEGFAINRDKIKFEVVAGEQNKVEWTPIERFVNANGEVTNYPKPEIEKDVNGKEHESIDRDKEYVYNIKIVAPKDLDNYKNLGVTDELDERLSFIADGSINDGWKVEGAGATKADVEFNYDPNTHTLTWEWNEEALSKLTPGEDIVITFTAKINPNAELIEEEVGIPNDAKLDFNNNNGSYTEKYPDPEDPEDPPTPPEDPPTTPPVTVDPTEGGIKVLKVDKSDNNIRLEGAEFKLTDENGDTVDASGTIIKVNGEIHEGLLENLTTDVNGEILITGLTPGTYYLHETKAPTYTEEDADGNEVEKPYRLLTKPVEVEVVDKIEDKEVKVENSKSGWELPTTGGIGTILFTLVGLILMGYALFAYVRQRKTAAQA